MRAGMAGNAVAYEQVLLELGNVLRATVQRLLARAGYGNAVVEDVIQETLLAIHLKRGTWNPALPLAPWVNAIVRYKTVDALRRQGKRIVVSIDEWADVLPAAEQEARDDVDIERLLRRLPTRQQHIVRAISMEGRSAAEVGRALALSEGNVRLILHRALKRLAALIRSDQP
jgi:RNA polymerase sigma-70 factor (ECF subfamily)